MADRYWVGGTANWDATAGTKWATTDGGAGGASVPTANDDVFFTAASGAVTVTLASSGTCRSLNFTGFTGTFAGGVNTINISGNLVLVSPMTLTGLGKVNFFGTSSFTITTAGKTLPNTEFVATGGTYTLQDAFTSSGAITVTNGTFNTNNFNVTATQLASTSTNVRQINLGSSTVTLSLNGQAIQFTTATNLTFNAGTSNILLTGDGPDIEGGGQTFNNVSFTGTLATSGATNLRYIDGANTFNNLSVTAPATAGVVELEFRNNQTINGTLSTNGTAGNERVWFRSGTYGVRRTLTVNSAPSLTDADFRDIIVLGSAAPISGARIGNRGACSGITFDAPKTVYWSAVGGGSWGDNGWAATSGGTPSTDNFPLPQDTAIIENTGLSVGATITISNSIGYVSTVNLSTRTNAVTVSFGTATTTSYGSWTNGSGVSFTGTNALTFSGEGTKTITSAGKTFSCDVTIDAYGGTIELADAINTGSRTLTITNGIFDTKNFTVSVVTLSSNNNNVRTIKLGSSTVNGSINGGAIQISGINLTLDAGTSQINITGTGSFSGGGYTYNNVSFTGSAGTRAVNDQNTFNNLTIAAPGGTNTVFFNFGGNVTVNGTLTISAGTSAIRRTSVFSNTIGTQRTLTCNAVAAFTDLDFRDIAFAGNCVSGGNLTGTRLGDCGGNSGITFPAPKTVYKVAGNDFLGTGWAASSGGAASADNFPLAQDTGVIDNNSSATINLTNTACNTGTIDASARTTAITLAQSVTNISCYGSLILSSAVTSSGAQIITFSGRGTNSIISAGVTWTGNFTIDCVTGTVQLGDALTLGSTRTLLLTSGTFDAVTYNVTTGLFNCSSATNTTLKMGSGLWTLSGTGTVWLNSTVPTVFLKGTADILLSDTSTSARTFSGFGLSYNKLTIGGATGISTTTISGDNQFTELASTKTVAHTIALGTTTQTFGKWTVTGSAGNVVTLTGTGTSHVLAGSATSGIDYLAMGSIGFAGVASNPAEFYAGANSTGTAGAPVFRTAAPTPRTLYWVGGTGNWSDTTKWALSSGGSGGNAPPVSLDNVVFDSASNATSYTTTVDTGYRVNSLTFSAPASGTVTWAGTSNLAVHGNVTLPATGLSRSFSGNIILSGSTTGKTFTTNGVTLNNATNINGVGCGWTLGSAVSIGSSSFTVTNGSFNTGNFNVTASSLISNNAHTRSITLGSSAVTLSGGTPINFTNSTNLNFSAGTSSISLSNTGPNLIGGGQTFYDVTFTSTSSGTKQVSSNNTFNNLTSTAAQAGSTPFVLDGNQTVLGTFTVTGTAGNARNWIRSTTMGVARTVTANALVATDCDFRDFVLAGAAAGTAPTRAGDFGGNTGVVFPASKNVYRVSNSTSWVSSDWALTSGGSASADNYPLPQDTAIIDNGTTLTGTLGAGTASQIILGLVDFSNRTNSITFDLATTCSINRGLILSAAVTMGTSTQTWFFEGAGSMVLNMAGKTISRPLTIDSPTGSLTLQNDLTSTSSITLNRGIFNLNNYNVSLSAISSANSNIRTIAIGSGTLTLTSNGTIWNASTSTNLTVTGTGTIRLTSASTKTFAGGGISYAGITIDQAGTGALTISSSNTFANIIDTAVGATTIALGTTTQRVANFTATGTAGNVLTITGNTSNLIYTSPGTVSGLDYLNFQGRAYGSNGELDGVWYAGNNSVNSGSLGWVLGTGSTTYNVVISENATLADVIAGTVTFAVEITENSVLDDSVVGEKVIYVLAEEGTTLAEVQDFVNLILAAITEDFSSAESQSALSEFSRVATEVLTAADSSAASGILSAILVESATLADTTSAQAVFVALQQEGLTVNDINQVATVISAALTEGMTVADTVDAVKALLVSITENVVSADTEAALKQLVGVIAENLNSAETQTTQTNFNAVAVEPNTLADVAQAQADFNSAITEATNIADILDAIRVLVGDLTENSDIADSQDRLAIFFRADVEALTSLDNLIAQANFNSNSVENLLVLDQEVGYGWFRIVDTQNPNWSLIGSSLWLNNAEDVIFWINNAGTVISWTTASGASVWTQINNQNGVVWVEVNNSQGT